MQLRSLIAVAVVQTGSCSSDSTSSLGTSKCPKNQQQQQQQKKKKEKKKKRKGNCSRKNRCFRLTFRSLKSWTNIQTLNCGCLLVKEEWWNNSYGFNEFLSYLSLINISRDFRSSCLGSVVNECDEEPWGCRFDPWSCSVGWGSGVAMSCGVGHRHGSDPALLWLRHRQAATATIRPLAWEPPCAMGAALKRQKPKNKIN